MPLKSLQHIKVIVQIDTNDNKMKNFINVIDETTLQINATEYENICRQQNFINQKMIFDCICDSTKKFANQFDDIIDKLLFQQDNCCLIRFNFDENYCTTTHFIEHLLITFDEHLQNSKYQIKNCHLMCTDVYMMTADTNLTETLTDDNSASYFQGYKMLRNTTNNFRNIETLRKWLLRDYRSKTQATNNYEKLHFIFTIQQTNKPYTFTVNLYLYNIYVNLMTTNEYKHWHHYMLYLSKRCSDEECHFVHSGLTVSLLSHLEGERSRHSYFLFDISRVENSSMEHIENVLEMADFIIKCRSNVQKIIMERSMNGCHKSVHRSTKIPVCVKGYHATKVTFFECTNNNNIKVMNTLNNKNNVALKKKLNDSDFCKLQLWYESINDYFNKFHKSLEAYYAEYFDKKIHHINNYVVASMINEYNTLNEMDFQFHMENHIDILYNDYNEARISFEQLYKEVNGTIFKDILRNYWYVKNYDNQKKSRKMHVIYLRKFQTNLNEYFEKLIFQINQDLNS